MTSSRRGSRGLRARFARAAGQPEPGYQELRRLFDERFVPTAYAHQQAAEHYQRRSEPNLRRFYESELASTAEAVAVEEWFEFELPTGGGGEPVRIHGKIDRIDRHPDGTIEVVDYKTGRSKGQAEVDRDEQLSTYALALRSSAVRDPATGEPLPSASLLSLYFTESGEKRSTTRTDGQLDAHAAHLAELARRIRSGDFAATPSYNTCGWCDYRRVCPSRWGGEG